MFHTITQVAAEKITTGEVGVIKMDGETLLTNSLNLVYFLAAAIAVIVIVVAGIMYATSSGDTGRLAKAKNLIIYAIVGLAVVFTAFAITNFVIGRFK